jgi:hypothetical protein
LRGCYDPALEHEDKDFQDAVIAEIIVCFRSYAYAPVLLLFKPHPQLFVSLLTAPFLKKMTKLYGPDSSLWKLSVAVAARCGTEDEIEVMMRSG